MAVSATAGVVVAAPMVAVATVVVAVAASGVPIAATKIAVVAPGEAIAVTVVAVAVVAVATAIVAVVVIAPVESATAAIVTVSATAIVAAAVPRASTDKDTAHEEVRTVKTIRGTIVGIVVVVSVRANGSCADVPVARADPNVKGNLSLCVTCSEHENAE